MGNDTKEFIINDKLKATISLASKRKRNLWALDRDGIRRVGAAGHPFALDQLVDALPFLSYQIVPYSRGAGNRTQFSLGLPFILCNCQCPMHIHSFIDKTGGTCSVGGGIKLIKREIGKCKKEPDWSLHEQPVGSRDPQQQTP